MSVITFVILQWDGRDEWLDVFNKELLVFDTERKQTLGMLTDFSNLPNTTFGLLKSGGYKWYTLCVAAAALNHVPAEKLREIFYKTFDKKFVSFASLQAIEEENEPIFVWRR